jgi:hypothetical protein
VGVLKQFLPFPCELGFPDFFTTPAPRAATSGSATNRLKGKTSYSLCSPRRTFRKLEELQRPASGFACTLDLNNMPSISAVPSLKRRLRARGQVWKSSGSVVGPLGIWELGGGSIQVSGLTFRFVSNNSFGQTL